MAKYEVKFSCGHTHTVELFGKMSERELKIKYLEEHGTCPECRESENAVDCEEVEMHYSIYKKDYSDCKTKSGSYNAKTKTIVVYVPKNKDAEKEAIKKIAEIAGKEITERFSDNTKGYLNTPFAEIEKEFNAKIETISDEYYKIKCIKIFEVIKNYKKEIGEI
ncbi:MAG: hypothetical protein ACI4IS_02955 [Acutalibacteraceae bacterium]